MSKEEKDSNETTASLSLAEINDFKACYLIKDDTAATARSVYVKLMFSQFKSDSLSPKGEARLVQALQLTDDEGANLGAWVRLEE